MRLYGRYHQLHPGTNLRIIALNPFVQDVLNSYIWYNVTDGHGQHVWLREVLDSCEKKGEHALIINHFPPYNSAADIGIDFCVKVPLEWTRRYLLIMDRYVNTIVGQLYGHSHLDTFEVIKSHREKEFSGVALVHSALTTDPSLYPAYRIYSMDPLTHTLLNFEQYRFDLEAANARDELRWIRLYNFREYYNVTNMEDRTFNMIANKIRVLFLSRLFIGERRILQEVCPHALF